MRTKKHPKPTGMTEQVIALRDGCPPRLEAPGEPSFPWSLVGFENGEVAAVDPEISYDKLLGMSVTVDSK